MFDQRDVYYPKLRQDEMMQRVERRRLVREALAAHSDEHQHVHFYAPLLARIGGGMVQFGMSLQTRYGAMHRAQSTPAPQLKQA
jgi:hypothetical protein